MNAGLQPDAATVSGATPEPGENPGSLFDAYGHADLVTYTTVHDGWGNPLMEAVAAKKPLALFEYPVYLRDIKPRGFEAISMGSTAPEQRDSNGLRCPDPQRVRAVAAECIETLADGERKKNG